MCVCVNERQPRELLQPADSKVPKFLSNSQNEKKRLDGLLCPSCGEKITSNEAISASSFRHGLSLRGNLVVW